MRKAGGGGGGGGGVLNKTLYEEARPRVQHLTLMYTILDRKGSPFVNPLVTNSTPFTSKNAASLLTAVNTLSLQYE